MTHSPTPTELLALRTAHAAEASKDASYDLVSTIVFALGSAQLLQSPETAAELSRLRARVTELEAATAEPLPDTEGGVAFRQIGRTPSLQGLRTELRIEGFPPLVGRYSGAGMRRLDDRRELLLIEPALVFVRASVEDSYVSPLHHDYRVSHDLDLPEVPHA